MLEKPPYSKISYPSVANKEFKWSTGSDVQALWRKLHLQRRCCHHHLRSLKSFLFAG
jgi:hypothetical protein